MADAWIIIAATASAIVTIVFSLLEITHKKKVTAKFGALIVVLIIILVSLGVLLSNNESSSGGDVGSLVNNIFYHNNSDGLSPQINVINGDVITNGTLNDVDNGIESSDDKELAEAETPEIPATVQDLLLNYSEVNLCIGNTESLYATVLYSDNSTDKEVLWVSSNPAIASVDTDGNITALSEGVVTITAQASRNNTAKTASCIVTVLSPSVAPTGYSIRLNTDRALLRESFRLDIIPNEDDITDIQVHTISPSGVNDSFPYGNDGLYMINTETGVWTIYASVTNDIGTYTAQKEEDYVSIEVYNFEDILKSIPEY